MEGDGKALFQGSWKWGPDGHGAILLVNCDCERTYWKKPDNEDDTISRVSGLNRSASYFLFFIYLCSLRAWQTPAAKINICLIALQVSSVKIMGPVKRVETLGAAICAGKFNRVVIKAFG